ncbi:MAG: hypothetical protein PHX88_07765, partial [Methanoculleus horonobensis]|nr:hypothetical protein [Methanoculleus horonobensis]
MVSLNAGRFSGAVPGALVVGAFFLLGWLGLLPAPIMTVALLFGGGFIAGLFTRGRVRDGAVAGAVCGVLVALIVASLMAFVSPADMTFGFYALIFTALL